MIQINLLPEELHTHQTKLPPLELLKIPIGIGGLLILLTLFLYLDFIFSNIQLAKLESQWRLLEPHQQELRILQDEVEKKLKPEKDFLNQYVTTDRPVTFLITWINQYLPETTWLTEVRVDRQAGGDSVLVKGFALHSKAKPSIEQIESYLQPLKEKLPGLELKLTTTRQILENHEVTEFIANFEKPKEVKK